MSNTRKTRASCLCNDCGWPTFWDDRPSEWYMVTDEIWAQAGMETDLIPWYRPDGTPVGPHDYLCVGCLEARLGRELTAADFTDAPINGPAYMHRNTPRLNGRLTT